MRRFILAAVLALFLHGFLLTISADHFTKKPLPLKRPEPVALSLTYVQPEKKAPPVIDKPVKPLKKIDLPKEEPKKEVVIPKNKKPITPVRKEVPEKKQEIIPEKKSLTAPVILPPQDEPIREVFVEHVPEAPLKEVREIKEIQGIKTNVDESPLPIPAPLTEASPRYRDNPVPEYPRMAKRRGFEGTAVIEVLVNKEGSVDDLRLYKSSGYDILDKAALESIKDWFFVPGRRGEQAVKMWVRVPVRFELR